MRSRDLAARAGRGRRFRATVANSIPFYTNRGVKNQVHESSQFAYRWEVAQSFERVGLYCVGFEQKFILEFRCVMHLLAQLTRDQGTNYNHSRSDTCSAEDEVETS